MAIKYVAQIENVQEVSVRGDSLVDPWRAELAVLGLRAVEVDGRVATMLSATSARFRGVRFREFSISVLVREEETDAEGWYLAHAFNSSRVFAWIERTMFASPYYFGAIDVRADAPAAVRVTSGDGRIDASMTSNVTSRRPQRLGPESWCGPLFLPARANSAPARRKWFFARLSGETEAYEYDSRQDAVTIAPAPQWPVLGQLVTSDFRGREWQLRKNAAHAKSRTYDRPTFPS